MARQKSKKWSDYLWLVSATYFTLGFFNIVFAWLGVICFMIPLFMAVFGWSFDVPWQLGISCRDRTLEGSICLRSLWHHAHLADSGCATHHLLSS